MSTLVSNGTSLYRYNNQLLRTPIKKRLTLTPTGQLLYDCGNEYVQDIPTRDFYVNNSGVFAIASGHRMRNAYLLRSLPSGARQIWRTNTGFPSYDTGMVFYNGNYSPAMGMSGGAAFLRTVAYRFSIPSQYTGWNIDAMDVTIKDHGVVMFSGKASEKRTDARRYPTFAWNANTQILDSSSSWRTKQRYLALGCFSYAQVLANDSCYLYGMSQDGVQLTLRDTDACANDGNRFYQMFSTWQNNAVSYNDGTIINARDNPNFNTHNASVQLLDACAASSSDFCLTLMPAVSDSGGDDSTITDEDYPNYYISQNSTYYFKDWWLCERYQIASVSVTLSLGE